jgi:hypothetical protein
MSNNFTFAELEAQHVELLPARTVLSLFSVAPPSPPTRRRHLRLALHLLPQPDRQPQHLDPKRRCRHWRRSRVSNCPRPLLSRVGPLSDQRSRAVPLAREG